MLPRIQEIAIATGTFIDPIWGSYKDTKTAKLIIYGTTEAASSAKKLVFDWIRELKDKSDDKWAKVWAYNKQDERRLRKQLKKNTERQIYRRVLMEDDQVPLFSINFAWPLDKEPEKILGPNYEALDPIRMDCQSWITREKRPGPAIFRIQSQAQEKLQDALKRMQHIPRSYEAKIFEMEPFAIIDVPQLLDSEELPYVMRIPYYPPQPLYDPPTKTDGGKTFRYKHPLPGTFAPQNITTEESPAAQLLCAITETTQHCKYFRGLLRMQIHLGTFVAQKTLKADVDDNTYTYTRFADMVEHLDKMNARVSAEIGDPIVESRALTRCFEGKEILAPQDAWTRELSDVKPVYAATFEIATPQGQGDLLLDVELAYEGGVSTLLSKRWYRLRENQPEPRKLLDGNILKLENGLAWHIGLEQYIEVDEKNLSQEYYIFPDTLTLDIHAAEDYDCHNFVIYRSRNDRILQLPIKSVRQRRLWRFNAIAGEWVVEVGKVDKTVFAQGQPQVLFEPRWTLNVYHNKWDELLAFSKHIEVGQAADWGRANAADLLFPQNLDTSILTGLARQEMDDSDDDDSDFEEDERKSDISKEEDDDAPEDPPSIKNFEDLLDFLRQLTDLVCGNA